MREYTRMRFKFIQFTTHPLTASIERFNMKCQIVIQKPSGKKLLMTPYLFQG